MELLLHWMRKQEIDDKMIYKNAAIKQECFFEGSDLYEASTHSCICSIYTYVKIYYSSCVCIHYGEWYQGDL